MSDNGANQGPVVTVSEEVADALKAAAAKANVDVAETVVRFSVERHGEGLDHHIDLEQEPAEGDVVFEQYGLTMVVDEEQVPLLAGAHFGYAEREGKARLVVSNPNLP